MAQLGFEAMSGMGKCVDSSSNRYTRVSMGASSSVQECANKCTSFHDNIALVGFALNSDSGACECNILGDCSDESNWDNSYGCLEAGDPTTAPVMGTTAGYQAWECWTNSPLPRTDVELSAPNEVCPAGINPSRWECQNAALTYESPYGKPLQPFSEISLENLPCGCIFYEGAEEDSISFNSHANCSSGADHEEDLYSTPYEGSRCSQTQGPTSSREYYDFFYKNSVISDWGSENRFVTCATFCHPYTKLPGYVGFATEKNASHGPVNRCMCNFDDGKLPGSNPVSNGAYPSVGGTAVGLVNSGRPNSIGNCYPYRFYNTRSLCKPGG